MALRPYGRSRTRSCPYLVEAAGPYPRGPHKVKLPPYERYVDDMAALAAAVRGEKPIHVSFDEDIVVQEAVIAASGM